MAEDDYEVGYKRPPRHSQFRAGRSGNPTGRPAGTKNLATDLREELAERIAIREGERVRKVSKQRAMLKALVAKALKGDARSATVLLGLMARLLGSDADTQESEALGADDLAILDDFLARSAKVGPAGHGGSDKG